MERYKEIERSIITKFRKDIYSTFVRATSDYKLIEENDKIMVCISGGKDSFLLAKCMEELQKHGKVKFDLIYVLMDPGYSENNLKIILDNAKLLNIDFEVFKTDIFNVSNTLNEENPCYMCARMRRGHLYNYAKNSGCNKIALGHHFDDVIETTLLSMFYGSEIKTMMPKLHSDNFEGLELIRPMFLIKESAILAWKDYNKLNFINCACKFTEKINNNTSLSKRKEMKELISNLRKINPSVDINIFKALDNINMNCILGWHKDNIRYSFLDNYENNSQD